MGKFAVGDIVLIDFPYSDLTRHKKRPALIVGLAEFDNLILCQITSSALSSKIAIKINASDISDGELPVTSYARPDKIFTADESIVHKRLGVLSFKKRKETLNSLSKIFGI